MPIEPSPRGGCLAHAITGAPGRPCIGVTFLPDEAVMSLSWGGSRQTPLLTAVCSRLKPDFAFVPSWEPDAAAVCAELLECGTEPLWVVRGPLDTVAHAEGWERALRASVADPAWLISSLDEAVAEADASVLEAASAGAAGIVVAEDVAGDGGPLLAPDFIISELVPRVGMIGAAAVREALVAVWHSDGDLRPFLPAAAKAGIVAVHPGGLELERFGDVFAVARTLGLAVLGGIPGEVLRQGGPAVVRTGVAAGLLAAGGGLLVCDDGGVVSGEELGMLIVALQAARVDAGGPGEGGGAAPHE